MAIKTIPAQTIKTCDRCGVTLNGKNDRQEGALHVKAHALDMQGVARALAASAPSREVLEPGPHFKVVVHEGLRQIPARAVGNPHKGGTQAYLATEHWNEGWNACIDAMDAPSPSVAAEETKP